MHCIVNVIVAVIILLRRLCIVSDFTDDTDAAGLFALTKRAQREIFTGITLQDAAPIHIHQFLQQFFASRTVQPFVRRLAY